MNSLRITLANMRQRALSTWLTMLLVAIGVGLVSLILAIKEEVDRGYQGVAGKFDLVVGPKGSPLQLVLNTVFHMDKPVGNLPWKDYETLQRKTVVKLAIPVVTGDNFRGFYLVGTIPEFLTELEVRNDRPFEFASGHAFHEPHGHEGGGDGHDHGTDFQAVLGSEAARQTGLRVGSRFLATHGVAEEGVAKHDQHEYEVVGVLEPTGTPHDRAVFVHLDTFFDLHEDSPEAKAKMLSGVLVLTHSPMWTGPLAKEINNSNHMMAVYPTFAIRDLMAIIGNINRVLVAISFLVLLAAGVSILVAIYNSMNERRREIAILRALGSPASTIFQIVVLEAAVICLAGGVAGLFLSRIAVLFGAGVLRDVTGLSIGIPMPGTTDLYLLLGAIAVGVVSSILPAVAAYRTDVATNIRPVN